MTKAEHVPKCFSPSLELFEHNVHDFELSVLLNLSVRKTTFSLLSSLSGGWVGLSSSSWEPIALRRHVVTPYFPTLGVPYLV